MTVDKRIAVLGIARMADALGNSFLIVVLPLYVTSGLVEGNAIGLSESLVAGIVLALFGIINSMTQPFAGRLSDRAGKRKLFVVGGLIVLAVANFSFSLVGNYAGLLVIRAFQGIGAALTITATMALVNELSVTGNRGSNMGAFNSFRLVGFGGGPLAAGVVLENGPYALGGLEISGFNASFYLASFAALISILLVTLFVDDAPETEPTHEELALAVFAHDAKHILDPIFTLGLASLTMAASIALLAPIEPQINAHLKQGPTLFGIQFASFIGAVAATQPLVGSLSDRYGRRIFIITGLIFLVPTTFVQGLAATPVQLIVARLLQGISGAMVFAPALALAGDFARRGQSGAQLSVLTVAFGLGISLGQLASGFLIRYGYVVPFGFGAGMAAIGAVLVYTQVPQAEQPAQERRSGAAAGAETFLD